MNDETKCPNGHRRAYSSLTVLAAFSLLVATGCDPCVNNPCDDGFACNGVETCSANGPEIVCTDSSPVECPPPEACTEPDGACVTPGCSSDADCDDTDACTIDTCTDTVCESVQVICPSGQVCDPATGECVDEGGGTTGTLIGAVGLYSGVTGCGDDDEQVMLVDDAGTLVLRGLTGNGDIPLTLTDDQTATATNVVAFGMAGHNLTLTLLPSGEITLDLERPGAACSDTLTSSQ